MEQYTISNINDIPLIIEGEFFRKIHQKHIESYGEKGANNIVQNVRTTYNKLMGQLASNPDGNHNSLLVGKVQSGKTSNLELLTAIAFDNGYNLLLIFGGYDKDLLRQSSERFGDTFDTAGGEEASYSKSPVLYTTNDSTKGSLPIESLDPEFVKELIEEKRPIIITCLKRPPAMKKALKALSKVQDYVQGIVPFIIDDEGDQASLNTAKDKARNSTPTYKNIVKIKEVLNNPLYLSVTATPQANIFQEDISALNPDSIHTVQPGIGYNGASIYHLSENQIVVTLQEEKYSTNIPDSLRDAIYYFIVASTIKRLRTSQKKEMRSDMIIHVDRTVSAHGNIYNSAHALLEDIKYAFANEDSLCFYSGQLKKVYDKYLDPELYSMYSFDAILDEVVKTILSTGIILQNSDGKTTKEKELTKLHKIYIGGDLLQRGLTFPNLLVSYFTRFAKNGGNMDTTLQRARWFGYRSKYLDLCKIFTTDEIAKEFSVLAEIEDDLWEQFDDVENGLLEIKDIIIQAENTKQKPTAKNKAKFKKISFKNRWIKQRFIVTNDDEIVTNNRKIQQLISSVRNWQITTVGSTNNSSTAQYALFSAEQLIELIESIDTAFDREPFNKKPLVDLVGSSDIPVILMWTDDNDKIRYRSIYNDDAHDRIKALHQGANTTDKDKLIYLGDKKVIVDPTKINVQIHYISPGYSKASRLEKDQYMFAIYLPKDKVYFVKEND
ncbi:MAG: Z1 domain-containing protein [Ruminococcaceae bacterium]|nr:Z1 domain-containing protein [Oscillospiraceae bacterium]